MIKLNYIKIDGIWYSVEIIKSAEFQKCSHCRLYNENKDCTFTLYEDTSNVYYLNLTCYVHTVCKLNKITCAKKLIELATNPKYKSFTLKEENVY